MKTTSILVPSLAFALLSTSAQSVSTSAGVNGSSTLPAPTAYQVVASGANHRIWQRQTFEPGPNGQVVPHIHQYTELASGLNYQDASGNWVESQELIEPFSGGAVARHGQYQVIFANDLNSRGAIDMQTPDGKRLQSNILGLMYVDTSTGDAVVIASLQDSQGQLISSNQVLYPNAFQGIKADVRYTYRRHGFEQDVILREQPTTPESLGMNSATTELEVFTEFIAPPEASVEDGANNNGLEADEDIGWGVVRLGQGKALDLGDQSTQVPVSKRYVEIHGRYFLLEKVPIPDIQTAVAKLPEQAANAVKLPVMAFNHLTLPKTPLARPNTSPMRLASLVQPEKGLVLDYVTLSSWVTNYTFQGDTTYYISSTIYCCGTNTFEAGTVLKFATNGGIQFSGGNPYFSAIIWEAGPYRPVIFTAKDDNTVGESFGTGNPTGYYGNPMLYIVGFSSNSILSNLRISYAKTAIQCYANSMSFSDLQIVNCQTGFYLTSSQVILGNALFANVTTNVVLMYNPTVASSLTSQNSTFSGTSIFAFNPFPFPTGYLAMTNCVLANVTNFAYGLLFGTNGNFNGFYQSPVFGLNPITNTFYPFQRAGAGSYYLTNGCNFLNAGTSNVFASVLADIASKTTYPPIVYSNTTLSTSMTFSAQAQRDTDTPDLGYHYDPLDYVFGGVNANSNLTFTAGTAIGWFELPGSGGPGYGIGLRNGMNVTFRGTVTSLCLFNRYSVVQEGGNGNWKDKGWWGGIVNEDSYNPSLYPTIQLFFTKINKPASDSNHFRDGTSGQPLAISGTGCEFLNGTGGYNVLMAFTNCLFYRAGLGNSTSETYPYEIYRNCTFHGGNLGFGHWEGSPPYWYSYISDCSFENTAFSIDDPFGSNTNYANYNFNAFLQGAAQPPTEGAHTITVTNFNWQTSWFGNFYLPPNSLLILQGSTTADQVGLSHFTTQTNQVPETNSIVDIGYHYVATDQYGNPLDTNGDGIPDYLEDSNGNGVFDLGDLGNWQYVVDNSASLEFTNGLNIKIFEPKQQSAIP